MKVRFLVNGEKKTFEVKPDEYLLDTLRNNNYKSVRRGCETSSCGICTVLMDGMPVASCSLLTAKAEGRHITTVEGIQEDAELLAGFFGREGADQCGYCNPSIALACYAMKRELKDPTDEEIKAYLVGNLCRCSGYSGQHRAIRAYLEVK
ncbi:MAG: 2Fe-2S iron-sulfur cluster binding domain-containing protein [Clostridia bacterium]|nr:2Fe-2S iron-sulfur cluster binding domain-containing protein [Clostridia bacterium]